MAAVPQSESPSESAASPNDRNATGLKPISRLISDDRVARIIPETESETQFAFCSAYARDFIRAHYNFCAAKFSVSRGGKTLAIDEAFRDAEAWFPGALKWVRARRQVRIPMAYEKIGLTVSHPLAGRLLRLLSWYDTLFAETLFAQIAVTLSESQRATTLSAASRKLGRIHTVTIPNNDRFDADGQRLDRDGA